MHKSIAPIFSVAIAGLTGCSALLNPELPELQDIPDEIDVTKFGNNCADDTTCGGYVCRSNRCTSTCSSNSDCANQEIAECGASGMCTFKFPAAVPEPSIGFLYVGPTGDHGWTKTHEDSRQYLEQNVTGIDSQFVPSVDPADAVDVMQTFIDEGNNIIIGTSFDFLVPIQNMAANNPNVNFLLCSGFTSTPNLGSYFGRMYQVMYLMGIIAARQTQTGHVGIVGPVIIPETVRHANAFAQGVRSVDPTVQVHIEWVQKWFDPPVEAAMTDRLIDEADADIIFGFTDTLIPMRTACGGDISPCTRRTTTSSVPVFALGYDNPDSCSFVPDRCLASAYWNWGPRLERIINDMKAGTWDPSALVWDQIRGTPDASMAYITVNEAIVPSDVQIAAEQPISSLTPNTEEARMFPFLGGMTDSRGNVRYEPGEIPTDAELLRMCWLADNIFMADGRPGEAPGCVGDN